MLVRKTPYDEYVTWKLGTPTLWVKDTRAIKIMLVGKEVWQFAYVYRKAKEHDD